MVTLLAPHRARPQPPHVAARTPARVTAPVAILAVAAAAASLTGLLTGGGPGRQVVETARGAEVTLYGEGL